MNEQDIIKSIEIETAQRLREAVKSLEDAAQKIATQFRIRSDIGTPGEALLALQAASKDPKVILLTKPADLMREDILRDMCANSTPAAPAEKPKAKAKAKIHAKTSRPKR